MKVSQKIKEVLDENNLEEIYTMSTSGSFAVRQCRDEKGDDFILKVRQKKDDDLRQKFINEILINKFLEENLPGNFPYKVLDFDFKSKPEFLLYKMLVGWTLNGYYFSIGRRQKSNFSPEKIIKVLEILHAETKNFINFSKYVKLKKNGFEENFFFTQKRKKFYLRFVGKEKFVKISEILKENKNILDKNLALSHGDLNPKNILTMKGKTLFIDWTDISLNNRLFDICLAYLSSWNAPEKREILRKQAIEKFGDERLFNLNILILAGKFFEVSEDSLSGINKDAREGFLDKKSQTKLSREVSSAEDENLKSLKEALDFFG